MCLYLYLVTVVNQLLIRLFVRHSNKKDSVSDTNALQYPFLPRSEEIYMKCLLAYPMKIATKRVFVNYEQNPTLFSVEQSYSG